MLSRVIESKSELAVFWAFLSACILILAVSPAQIQFLHGYDKIAHFSAFATLMILPSLLLQNLKNIFICAGALLLFGIGIESLQLFLPLREASFADIAANALGIGVGLIPSLYFLK